ncbi:hypothetical protein [Pseudomonas fluorescens]|uniref:hypothetical protein n=1 Tax=Pseudomonas fluorescens TaxID=294 RepID=UPI00123F3190|nr:hypothetical protein [Pseudomonas fluorescens]
MELLDSDIHFPKYDILMPNVRAITTPIRKLANYPATKVSGIRGSAIDIPQLKLVGERWCLSK